jgi:hypothetical protein
MQHLVGMKVANRSGAAIMFSSKASSGPLSHPLSFSSSGNPAGSATTSTLVQIVAITVLSINTQSELDQTAGLVRSRRHKPVESSLYPIIEHHLPRFLSHVSEQGSQLPRFVTQEFDDYLACGRLEHGFLRVKCDSCRYEHLLTGSLQSNQPFSCKSLGFCPSCGARRIIETSAHLIDQISSKSTFVFTILKLRLTASALILRQELMWCITSIEPDVCTSERVAVLITSQGAFLLPDTP